MAGVPNSALNSSMGRGSVGSEAAEVEVVAVGSSDTCNACLLTAPISRLFRGHLAVGCAEGAALESAAVEVVEEVVEVGGGSREEVDCSNRSSADRGWS
jgi:hypothetical protein